MSDAGIVPVHHESDIIMETVSNFPGVFTVQGERVHHGLEGKDAVLVGIAGEKGQTAVEGLRAQLLAENILREGQDGIKATMAAECNLAKETLISRFEAKENQREIEDKIRLDGEKTRDLIRAQSERQLLEQLAELRAEVKRLTPVVVPPVPLRA